MAQTMMQTTTERIQALGLQTTLSAHAEEQPAAGSFPKRLGERNPQIPKLTREQCGHIRHFHNIASQLDGDWAFMGSQEPGQEWDTALRYQIANMAYAAGAAHYHRLPAMRSVFKPLIRRLIAKMMRREVWGYWYLTSQSGIRADPDLKELRKPWADPVCKENIMYSGHLLLMTSLYSMLFDDDSFDQEDGIVFNWNPLFFGMGPQRYSYTRTSLQESILREMERENWMGVCCEPNMIFIICNQFPIIATRYNDVRNGTSIVDDVLTKYRAAWAKKGMVSENGLFRAWYAPKRDAIVVADEISHSAWVMAFMPWNYDQVQSMYPKSGVGFLTRIDDRLNLNSAPLAKAIKELASKEGKDPDSPSVVAEARKAVVGKPTTLKPYPSPTFGYIAQWLSEIPGPTDLDALLRHADKYLHPQWSNGGLYYPRCDAGWDEDGNYTYMEPYSGNAAIGYARLNVKDGQKKMWDQPWTKKQVEARPWIDGVGLEQGIDCLRGQWIEEEKAMVATFRTWDARKVSIKVAVKNLPPARYGVYIDGELKMETVVEAREEEVAVGLEIGDAEINLVVLSA